MRGVRSLGSVSGQMPGRCEALLASDGDSASPAGRASVPSEPPEQPATTRAAATGTVPGAERREGGWSRPLA